MISREEYFPFGETSFGSFEKKRYRFCGKERDEESGLYYYGARYYAPWMCRFVSVDPLAAKYPFYTPYQYAGNKPINAMDLDGLEEEPGAAPGTQKTIGQQGFSFEDAKNAYVGPTHTIDNLQVEISQIGKSQGNGTPDPSNAFINAPKIDLSPRGNTPSSTNTGQGGTGGQGTPKLSLGNRTFPWLLPVATGALTVGLVLLPLGSSTTNNYVPRFGNPSLSPVNVPVPLPEPKPVKEPDPQNPDSVRVPKDEPILIALSEGSAIPLPNKSQMMKRFITSTPYKGIPSSQWVNAGLIPPSYADLFNINTFKDAFYGYIDGNPKLRFNMNRTLENKTYLNGTNTNSLEFSQKPLSIEYRAMKLLHQRDPSKVTFWEYDFKTMDFYKSDLIKHPL